MKSALTFLAIVMLSITPNANAQLERPNLDPERKGELVQNFEKENQIDPEWIGDSDACYYLTVRIRNKCVAEKLALPTPDLFETPEGFDFFEFLGIDRSRLLFLAAIDIYCGDEAVLAGLDCLDNQMEM